MTNRINAADRLLAVNDKDAIAWIALIRAHHAIGTPADDIKQLAAKVKEAMQKAPEAV